MRLSPARLEHSRRVAATAASLARRWGGSPDAAELGGLLHDYCREMSAEDLLAAAPAHGVAVSRIAALRPVGLLHAPVAAAELRHAGLDADVAAAIARHTVGGPGMSVLERCLYLADLCEPGRDLEGLEGVRALAWTCLDEALAAAVRHSMLHLVRRRRAIVPETLDLYNELHA